MLLVERHRDMITLVHLSLGLTTVMIMQPCYRPGVAERVPAVKVPRIHDNSTG